MTHFNFTKNPLAITKYVANKKTLPTGNIYMPSFPPRKVGSNAMG